MQNALQNPHFKKIWEKVNWKIRHPEAKSLEEALNFEREEPLNLLVAYSWPRDRIFTSVEYDTRNFDNGMARVECVLGRPITLEDILLLKEYDNLQSYISDGKIGFFVTGRSEIDIINLFDWQLGNYLYEQTPETWEKIANLI